MANSRINPVVMPKWGLSMREGKVTSWLVADGTAINIGDAILEIETDKIAGVVEATDTGVLRRRVGHADATYPVKTLLGVIADPAVSDAEIEAFVSTYVVPLAEAEESVEAPAHAFAETPTGTLRYAKRGDGGEDVLLLHGFGGDLDNWLFNIDALAEVATVYALDLPGHGQSVKRMADPSLDSMTQAVVEFMDGIGLAKAHLVGHSMGGAIAMMLAARAPGRVKSLSLVCPAGLGPEIGGYIEAYLAAQGRRDLKPALEILFADKGLVSRQLVDDVLKYRRLDGVEGFLKSLAGALFSNGRQRHVLAQELSGRLPPTLVIWGRQDAVIPAAQAANLAGAKVHVIEDAGHMVFMEKAGEVNGLIRAHIGA